MTFFYIFGGRKIPLELTCKQIDEISYLTEVQKEVLQDIILDDVHFSLEDAILIAGSIFPPSKRICCAISQSEMENNEGEEQENNVGFADEVEETQLSIGSLAVDETYNQGMQENAYLGDFLSRPVLIHSINWTVGAVVPNFEVINPWLLFLSNPKVVNKIETFKLFHGSLKIKILINGSPFHYGRYFFGVRPTKFDNNTSLSDPTTSAVSHNQYDGVAAGFRTVRSARTLYSSRPHVFIDPATNQPAHIDWPFFAATNWLDLTLKISDEADSIDRMGRLEMWELNTLKHSNNATDPVTINVYAWMEDVTLTGLTSAAPATAQSEMKPKKGGKKGVSLKNNASSSKDEYNKGGAISAPATALASAASYFTAIPYIGKFAKATQMAAGTVGDIARMFGFSRPAIVSDVDIFRPQTFGNMANTVGGDPLTKLTLDPKQELTVDPSTVGLPGEDQMSIGFLAKKEALIDVFTWNESSASDTTLYGIKVHPMVAPIDDVTASPRYWQTPLSFVTLPFGNWSGSLKYRFQIVCSAFHRGRLAIVYDPDSAYTAAPDYNSRYVQIVDITETKDFTIEVKWSQSQAYGFTKFPFDSVATITGAPTDFTVNELVGTSNGALYVYVVNELASPVTNSTIDINVYLSAGDDYEVKAPSDDLTSIAYSIKALAPGPPATSQSEFITNQENDPEQMTSYMLNGSSCRPEANKSSIYFGETVVSIRSLLKRYCGHRFLSGAGLTANAYSMINYKQFNLPNGPGRTYGSSIASPLTPLSGSENYNLCFMTYTRYFMAGYVGWRGGIRWKIMSTTGAVFDGSVKVTRSSAAWLSEIITARLLRSGATVYRTAAQSYLSDLGNNHTQSGTLINSTSINNTLEYEVPLYTPYRYVECQEPPITYDGNKRMYQSHYDGGLHDLNTVVYDSGTNDLPFAETYTSVAEDFSLFFFIGAPPYYETDIASVTPSA